MRISASDLLLPLALLVCSQTGAQTLPTRFEHNRIFVEAVASDGERITFYTDTGGGYNAVVESVAKRYSLTHQGTTVSDGSEYRLVGYPVFMEAAGIPRPAPDPWLKGNLAVVPDSRLEADGLLGNRWFAGGIWKFEYGKERLSRIGSFEGAGFNEVPLGFRHGANGERDLNFPRINIVIDGQSLPMLLDTGATAKLTDISAPVFGLAVGALIGTSYITRSTFDNWRDRHPDWRIIDNADAVNGQDFPMIEVPSVEVAGIAVGPVWFSRRPDHNFRKWMSQMTDQSIEGAIGGSVFKYLRMVIDYPAAMAYVQPLSVRDKPDE